MRELKDQLVGLDPKFKYRGLNQTRIETFSDAVFAFTVTLVALSSSVPETFEELKESFRDIIPFFLCAVLIVVIWYQHYMFFLRYGLQDLRTVVINTFLLFVLLIYVYPLKFLMTFLFELYFAIITDDFSRFKSQFAGIGDGSYLMTSYGLGASLIFLSLSLLYRHAYKRSEALGMGDYETFTTKISVQTNLLLSSIPALSAIMAVSGVNYIICGFIYMLYPPVMITFGRIVRRRSSVLFPEND